MNVGELKEARASQNVSGGEALARLMSKIDISAELAKEEARAKGIKGADLDKANKKIRILRNLKELGLRPEKAFIMQNIPVIPPKYRPVYPDQSGMIVESPINHLYKNVMLVNKALQGSMGLPLEEDQIKSRGLLHESLKEFQGFAAPTGARKELLTGIFDMMTGDQPKRGYFQNKLLSKRQDVSGRSTIVLNPDLHMDQAGIPEEMAWRIFEPFMAQELVAGGYSLLDAVTMVKDRDPRARNAMDLVAEKRPVLLNRAPSLHKHSILAFRPKIVKGRSIELPPLVTKGFNADFDGDTMSVEVPVTNEAVEEAMEMIPSKNMLSTSGKILTTPSQSAQLGLYLITNGGAKTGKKYTSDQDAIVAHKKSEIKSDDLVHVNGVETTVGRILVNMVLPPKLRNSAIVLDKKKTQGILEDMARNNPREASVVAEKLKDIGFKAAYDAGFSVALDDFSVDTKARDPIIKRIKAEMANVRASKRTVREKEEEIESVLLRGQADVGEALKKGAKPGNNLVTMVRAGARGEWGQIQQMSMAPVAVEDALGKIVPALIGSSYSEGLSPAQYWNAMHGARKGMIERTLRTSEPGALNKSLLHTTVNYPVTEEDCGTKDGITMSADSREVTDRYLSADAGKVAKRGEMVTSQMVDRLLKAGVKTVSVRSPVTCQAAKGICKKCAGLDEYGNDYGVGVNLGAISAQSVTEPATQMMMSVFHSGGLASGEDKVVNSFRSVKAMLEFPENFPEKATISEATGKVESVSDSPLGGWNVVIGGKNHYIAPDRKVSVKKDEEVDKGTKISHGTRDPKDVLRVLGVLPMRTALVEDLAKIYRNAGPYVKQKHFETVVRAITDSARVRNPGPSDYVAGDIVPYNQIRALNASSVKKVPLDEAVGSWLAEPIEGITPEKILSENDVDKIRAMGIKSVMANPDPVDFEPVLKGINTIPLKRRDWLSQMAFRRIKDAIREGVAEGWQSDLHSTNPIPGIVYGAEFGMGKFASENNDGDPEEVLARNLSDARDEV
jgi:DNA-directed RNA polymerase subunit beta'